MNKPVPATIHGLEWMGWQSIHLQLERPFLCLNTRALHLAQTPTLRWTSSVANSTGTARAQACMAFTIKHDFGEDSCNSSLKNMLSTKELLFSCLDMQVLTQLNQTSFLASCMPRCSTLRDPLSWSLCTACRDFALLVQGVCESDLSAVN